jgi:hypothetical protein
MTDDEIPPVDEISGWRELLDGLGQLTVAWYGIQRGRDAESGGATRLPAELQVSLTRGGQQAAEALAGLAELLAEQGGGSTSPAQRQAAQQWAEAHRRAAAES